MESGLPAESFMACCDVEPGKAKRRVRFRPNSFWKNNRKVGERLSWRGRSFVEAFADVNRREILKAALVELRPEQVHVALDAWKQGTTNDERFHFVCQSSPGAYMRIGEEDVQTRGTCGASMIASIRLCCAPARGRAFTSSSRSAVMARRRSRPEMKISKNSKHRE